MRSIRHALTLSLFALSFAASACSAEPAEEKQEEKDSRKRKSLDADGTEGSEGDKPLKPSQPSGETPPAPSPPAPETPQGVAAKNTCEAARSIGTISGDTNADKVTSEGTCSEWLTVRVSEDQSGFAGVAQRIVVTLVPPTGVDFDVDVFVNTASDVKECTTVKASGRTAGDKTETVAVTWGEQGAANGAEDGRTVNILVKAKGACNNQSWSIVVEGNR